MLDRHRLHQAVHFVAAFHRQAARAQPGQVWTFRYKGFDRFGDPYEDHIAGYVTVVPDYHPDPDSHGLKVLGEANLAPLTSWYYRAREFAAMVSDAYHERAARFLTCGDTAPAVFMLAGQDAAHALRVAEAGTRVIVESCGTDVPFRCVVSGIVHDPHPDDVDDLDDDSDDEPGREVGGDWVTYDTVTGIFICPPTDEPAKGVTHDA